MRSFALIAIIGLFSTLTYGGLTLTTTNLGGNMVAIGYTTGGATIPVGFGLNITASNGAKIASVVSSSSYFPIHPGTIMIDSAGNITNYGTPVSPASLPGASGSGLGTSKIIAEMAVKGQSTVAPGSYADFNYDGLVDNSDLAIFASNWLGNSRFGDINYDGRENFADYAPFLDAQSYTAPPSTVSQLLVLQINLNGAANTMITVTPESTYRGGVMDNDGVALTVLPASIAIPEPATIGLFALGGLILRKRKR